MSCVKIEVNEIVYSCYICSINILLLVGYLQRTGIADGGEIEIRPLG